MNPAVAIALCWEGSLLWPQIWAYLLAEFAAAIIATYTFLYVNGKE
jgi:glycerol uptake facilitator-like aquaporin